MCKHVHVLGLRGVWWLPLPVPLPEPGSWSCRYCASRGSRATALSTFVAVCVRTMWYGFGAQARDPMSGNPLYSVQMVRNAPLAKEITEWLEARPGVEITLSEMAHDRFMQVGVVQRCWARRLPSLLAHMRVSMWHPRAARGREPGAVHHDDVQDEQLRQATLRERQAPIRCVPYVLSASGG